MHERTHRVVVVVGVVAFIAVYVGGGQPPHTLGGPIGPHLSPTP